MVATKLFYPGAAVLLAAAGQVAALGSAIFHNQCPFEVYLWSISNVDGPMQTLAADGGEYSESYQINPDGGGVSVKLGSDPSRQNITQYEYTLTGDSLWYDLSNINGYPFAEYGVTVVPSDTTCRGVACPAGTALCGAAYNVPTDNFATAECGADADTVVVLCSGETDTSGSASVSSIASVAASTAQPVSVFSTTTEAAAPTTTKAAASSTAASTEPTVTHQTQHHPTHHSVVEQVVSATPAPAVTTEASTVNPYVIVHTTFVTHIVTVEARSPQPTAAAQAKRDVHHEHAAIHQEHPARRHSHPRAFARV